MTFSTYKTTLLSAILVSLLVGIADAQRSDGRRHPPRRLPNTRHLNLTGSAVLERNIMAHMQFLADDALQGRGSTTQYELIAGQYIASQLQQFGIAPAGDSSVSGKRNFLQTVTLQDGKSRTWNVVGELRGGDQRLAKEIIILSAHMDHLGVNPSASGDNIYNGADDDASGVVAVLELARALGDGLRPKRTVYFVLFGSEEKGGLGSKYFIENMRVPLGDVVANLQFEMIGRPDAKVPADTLWLTGYDRSNLGPELAKRGALLVRDPHPEEKFFQRSDNYTLAKRGIVAHTVSSFGLHKEYHQPDDDLAHINSAHMTRAIKSLMKPVRWLTNSAFRPGWVAGKKP